MGKVFENFEKIKNLSSESVRKKYPKNHIVIQVGTATCEIAAGSDLVLNKFKKLIQSSKKEDISIKLVGCTGRCSMEPIVAVFIPNSELTVYKNVDEKSAEEIFNQHIL